MNKNSCTPAIKKIKRLSNLHAHTKLLARCLIFEFEHNNAEAVEKLGDMIISSLKNTTKQHTQK